MSSDLAGRVSGLLGLPFIPGNRVTLLKNGDAIFPKMLEAIRAAERHIEFCTFVYWTGPIATEVAMALRERAQSGVRVRVLLDGFGANKMRRRLVRKMRDAGVEVRWFRPLLSWRFWQIDNRTHRKILVCDGRVAFTGGVGVAEEWQGDARNPSEWRDTHFRIEGPAVVSIQAGFWNNWLEASGGLAADTLPVNPEVSRDIARPDDVPKVGGTRLLVMRSNATTRWSDVASLMSLFMADAEKKIVISTAYFAPAEATANALARAIRRGVDVEIMFPGQHADKRLSHLASGWEIERLLDAGAKLWRYERTMYHVKSMIVDDELALVGSANFNHRSWMKDDELCAVTDDADLIAQLRRDFDDDCRHATLMDRDCHAARSAGRRITESLARIIRVQT